MSTAATQFGRNTTAGAGEASLTRGNTDAAESLIRRVDGSTKSATGVSLFHVLTLASIGGSLALFLAGKRSAAIFVGLWPPTFQALKSVADTNKNQNV
jgi:hypothetical protein